MKREKKGPVIGRFPGAVLFDDKRVADEARTITVGCLDCKAERIVAPGEIAHDDYPMCPTCFMPMVIVKASAR